MTYRLRYPPARMMADVLKPLMSKSWAAPTRSECPEISAFRGRSPLSLTLDCLMILLTVRSQIGRSMQRPWLRAQNTQSTFFVFARSHCRSNVADLCDPKHSRLLPYWSVLLRLITPRSDPSPENVMSCTVIPANLERRARKSYHNESRARLRIPVRVSGWALSWNMSASPIRNLRKL